MSWSSYFEKHNEHSGRKATQLYVNFNKIHSLITSIFTFYVYWFWENIWACSNKLWNLYKMFSSRFHLIKNWVYLWFMWRRQFKLHFGKMYGCCVTWQITFIFLKYMLWDVCPRTLACVNRFCIPRDVESIPTTINVRNNLVFIYKTILKRVTWTARQTQVDGNLTE